MSLRRIAGSAVALGAGYAVTAGLWWALLNVPESNVLALALSAALVVVIVGAAGVTTGWAVALGSGSAAVDGGRQAVRALPYFVGGLVVFAGLWWITGLADGWWQAHRGEVDAVILVRLGATRTQWLHQGVFLTTWLVRWLIGLSVIAALVLAGVRWVRPSYCLRLSVNPASLLTAAIGLLIVTQGLWRLAYWRPSWLPANSVELAFAVAKLGFVYIATIAIASAVLNAYARRVLKTLPPSRISFSQPRSTVSPTPSDG